MIYDVTYVPGLSKNLLSARKASKTSGKSFVCYENKVVLRMLRDQSFVSRFCSRTDIFSASGVRHGPHPETALAASTTRGSPGVGMTTSTASRKIMKVHRMLMHLSEDITRKTVEQMGIVTIGE